MEILLILQEIEMNQKREALQLTHNYSSKLHCDILTTRFILKFTYFFSFRHSILFLYWNVFVCIKLQFVHVHSHIHSDTICIAYPAYGP